jgi:hypothetical protein
VQVKNDTPIYLDIDGVLTDFNKAACRAIGITMADMEAGTKPGPSAWGFWGVAGLTESDFWAAIDREGAAFWDTMEWLPDGRDILNLCLNAGPVILMTSPPWSPEASAGKVSWIRREIPELRRRFSITPCKEAFAHARAILVDDSDSNTQKFHEAGGRAVLVPRRWNGLHEQRGETLTHVRRAVTYWTLPMRV